MIYFVDTENVGGSRLDVNTEDFVFYFIGNSCPKYVLDDKEGVHKLSNNESYVIAKHDGKKDGLDFAIDTSLGFMVHKHGRNRRYCIVSSDRGFDVVCNFWKSNRYDVKRSSLREALNGKMVKKNYTLDYIDERVESLPNKKKRSLYNICHHLNDHKTISYVNFRYDLERSLGYYLEDKVLNDIASQIYYDTLRR